MTICKINFFPFRDPNIIVTAGLLKESSVRIWDIRTLNSKVGPLATLEHNAGVNAARFNPTDGTKLMTSDQDSEIRVYPFQSSILGEPEPIIINQYHRQFQHLTPYEYLNIRMRAKSIIYVINPCTSFVSLFVLGLRQSGIRWRI